MRKIALAVFVFFLLLAFAFFSSIYFLLQNKDFQRKIIDHVQSQFHNQVTFASFQTSFFPPISLLIHEVTVKTEVGDGKLILKSPQLKIYLRLWPLFFRKVDIGYIHARNVSGFFSWGDSSQGSEKKLVLSGYDIELHHVALGNPIGFSVRGNFFNSKENLRLPGKLTLRMKDNAPQLEFFQTDIHLKDVDLSRLVPDVVSRPSVQVKQGLFSWDGVISWAPEQLSFKGEGSLHQIVYALSSTPAKVSSPADFNLKLVMESNFLNKQVQLRDAVLSSPYGDFLIKGNFGAGFEEPPFDLQIRSTNVNLDRLPELLVPLDKAIPNKFGFSGQMQMNLFVKGKKKDLSITGSSDWTASLLSYGSYFTKPKDLPLKFQFDWTLKDLKKLRGDFNLWLKEMTLKGSLVDWNASKGTGEITFLTNKFSLTGWEDILQPLRQYPMQGWAKVLVNAKGFWGRPEELRYGSTVTLENTQAVFEGLPIKNLNAILEFTNRRASSGRMDFVAQSSPIHLEYLHNIPPHESWLIKCLSPEWYPYQIISPLKAWVLQSKRTDAGRILEQTERALAKILPSSQPLKNVSFSTSWIGNLISIQDISFYLYDGSLRGSGEVELASSEPHYHFGIQIDKLNLKSLIEQMTGKPLLEGNFYLLGNFEGDGTRSDKPLERLRGQGEFKVVGGTIRSFDLLGIIAGARQPLGSFPINGGVTEFSDLQSRFIVENGKVITDQVTLINPRFTATANGFFTFEGVLNYRLNVVLAELMGKKTSETGSQNSVGVPLQIYGDFSNPKISLDSSAVTESIEKLVADRLFKRKKSQSQAGESVSSSPPKTATVLKEAGVALLQEVLSRKGKNAQAGGANQ